MRLLAKRLRSTTVSEQWLTVQYRKGIYNVTKLMYVFQNVVFRMLCSLFVVTRYDEGKFFLLVHKSAFTCNATSFNKFVISGPAGLL